MLKIFLILVFTVTSFRSMAYTIECLSQENLQASRLGFDSLKIVSTRDGNSLIMNDVATPLGEKLPTMLNPLARVYLQSEGFTVIQSFKFGDNLVFPVGSELSYVQDRMELSKWRDTQVTLRNLSRGIRITLNCQMLK